MARHTLAFVLVLLVIYLVPFVLYGGANLCGALPAPTLASPGSFLAGVLITKLGTAAAFVLLFSAGQAVWGSQWLLYALVWFIMFALSELGDLVAARTTGGEAFCGILAEAIYAPLAAFIVQRLLGNRRIES